MQTVKHILFLILGAWAWGLIGYFVAMVFGTFVGLLIAFWKEGVFARIYYSLPVALCSIGLLVYLDDVLVRLSAGSRFAVPELGMYAGFITGIGLFLWAGFAGNPATRSKPSAPKPYDGRMRTLLDRSILLLSWIGGGMLMVDLIFFAPRGSFLINFTWLSDVGVTLAAAAFLLLGIRRLFLKPSGEPKWNRDKPSSA